MRKTRNAAPEHGRKPGGTDRRPGRDTLALVAVVCLLVGFVAGMGFQAYRAGTAGETMGGVSAPSPMGSEGSGKQDDPGIRELEEAAKANPGRAEPWTLLGNAYFDANRYDEAIRAYRRSLDLDAGNPSVWTDLGVMYRRSGQPQEAIRAFDRATEADPDHEISRFNKGVVLLHDLEDVQGAIDAWEGLLRVNPMATAPNGQPLMEIVRHLKEGHAEP